MITWGAMVHRCEEAAEKAGVDARSSICARCGPGTGRPCWLRSRRPADA
nr:hypothetical protein [Rhodothermus marinus]